MQTTSRRTIGNPLSWALNGLLATGEGMGDAARAIGMGAAPPKVHPITADDIRTALKKGLDDALTFRADVIFAVLVYPVIGILLTAAAFHAALIPVIFPVAAGFALIGPFAATGLYEMSRRREAGESVNWFAATSVIRRPGFAPILVLGLFLMALMLVWLSVAWFIWQITLGPVPPASAAAFAADVLTTPAGWAMILLGCGAGLVFAAAALAVSVISFPLMVDRPVGLTQAVATSIRLTRQSPRTVALWGLIVAVTLAVASIPLFLGLIFALPVLGHATWHLYRAAVS